LLKGGVTKREIGAGSGQISTQRCNCTVCPAGIIAVDGTFVGRDRYIESHCSGTKQLIRPRSMARLSAGSMARNPVGVDGPSKKGWTVKVS